MRDVRTAVALAALLLLLAGGCEVTPGDEFTPVMSVHGLVWRGNNNYRSTPVFLNRTYGINETPANLLHSAGVTLRQRGMILDFLEESEAWWRPWARSALEESAYAHRRGFGLRTGDTVWLQVAHPDFDTLFARTIVPDTFWITHPNPWDTVTARDSLVFRRSRGAYGYLVSFQASFQGEYFWSYFVMPQESIPGVPYDTLYERIPLVWLNYIEPGPQSLRVMAMDSNYYVWMTEQGRGPRGRRTFLSAGVENGVGVFGSGSEAEVRVVVRQDSTDSRRVPERPWAWAAQWRTRRSDPQVPGP